MCKSVKWVKFLNYTQYMQSTRRHFVNTNASEVRTALCTIRGIVTSGILCNLCKIVYNMLQLTQIPSRIQLFSLLKIKYYVHVSVSINLYLSILRILENIRICAEIILFVIEYISIMEKYTTINSNLNLTWRRKQKLVNF